MPSPFPGMDPYLEVPDLWPDVHHELIGAIRAQLNSKVRDQGLVVRVELRTFMFDQDDPAEELYVIPDARIVVQPQRVSQAGNPVKDDSGKGSTALAKAVATGIDVTGQTTQVAQQRFLEIRDVANRQVVTVIELVSPSNKIAGSAGRKAFLEKRKDVASSSANWFEVDLLRRGTPTVQFAHVPRSAYRAFADRVETDSRRQLYWPIHLREPLPKLPVPLRPGEADVTLDLQAALELAFRNAAYDADVDYSRPPKVQLEPDDAAWATALLQA